MLKRVFAFIALPAIVAAAACQSDAPRTERAAQSPTASTTPAAASFVNKVWTVAESEQVSRGELRVFLSGGTLVMASPNSTPAFGTWSYDNGQLSITEEGQKYNVDILELSQEAFRIRIHSPGEPVVIRFAPAESVPLLNSRPPAPGSS